MKILVGLLLAIVLAGSVYYFFRDPPVTAPPAAAGPARASESPRTTDKLAPRRNAPATEVAKVTSSSDPFEFVRALAKSAYDGDGRAQFLIGRELDKCEMTLTLIRKVPGDPEAVIWGMPDSWPQTLKERTIAEYRRCARLMKEDPFAELPPRKGGYPFQYWQKRAAQSDYPLAVTKRTLDVLVLPSADAADARKLNDEQLRELTKATASGDPDVALTIGMRQAWVEDPARAAAGSAWMLAACRLGADCGASSKIYPFFMCYEPDYPNCDRDGDVELVVSQALSPERYADAYAQSQVIEEALRSQDPAAIQALLEKLLP